MLRLVYISISLAVTSTYEQTFVPFPCHKIEYDIKSICAPRIFPAPVWYIRPVHRHYLHILKFYVEDAVPKRQSGCHGNTLVILRLTDNKLSSCTPITFKSSNMHMCSICAAFSLHMWFKRLSNLTKHYQKSCSDKMAVVYMPIWHAYNLHKMPFHFY